VPAAPAPLAAVPLAPRERTRRGERTAERILDAAEALFAERGFAGTTLRDVAAAVGIRNPSLYNHFAGKDELYAAVLERGIRPVIEALAAFVATEDREERRRVLLERLMALLARRPKLLRLIQFETLTGGTRLTPALRDWIGMALERASTIVAEDPGTPPWSQEQIPLLVLALYHAVVGYFTIAPLYQDLTGADLLADESLSRQTAFLDELSRRLLPDAQRS
jgi:AcrR family transcriptional regulator